MEACTTRVTLEKLMLYINVTILEGISFPLRPQTKRVVVTHLYICSIHHQT